MLRIIARQKRQKGIAMLRLEHLIKNYGAFTLDCSMEIKPGRVTGLVGQNGAGKSTTFKAVLGLISPDSGTIHILAKI